MSQLTATWLFDAGHEVIEEEANAGEAPSDHWNA